MPGVFYQSKIKGAAKYRSQIIRNKTKISLGLYRTPEEAQLAFNLAYAFYHPGKSLTQILEPIAPSRRALISWKIRNQLGIPHPSGPEFFGLVAGETERDLKQAHRALLLYTRAHPDQGGLDREFYLIQSNYEISKRSIA